MHPTRTRSTEPYNYVHGTGYTFTYEREVSPYNKNAKNPCSRTPLSSHTAPRMRTLAAKAFSAASFSARVRPRWALLGGSLVTAAAASGSTAPQHPQTQQHQTRFSFSFCSLFLCHHNNVKKKKENRRVTAHKPHPNPMPDRYTHVSLHVCPRGCGTSELGVPQARPPGPSSM